MVRLLLVVAIVALVFWLLRGYRRNLERGRKEQVRGEERLEEMVRCAQCGVHVPRSESISSGGEHFCSVEHRRLHESQVP